MKARWCVLAMGLVVGCGPAISETRMSFAPPREATCTLEFVQAGPETMMMNGPWELLGHVVLRESGVTDPMAPRYRDIVRPRACAMGGTAIAIMMSSSNQFAMGSGSGTIYGVLRPRPTVQVGAPPTAF